MHAGLKCVRVHKVLKYRQCKWLEPYIKLNSKLRAQTNDKFEREFYKGLNNSLYGRMFMDVFEHMNVYLCSHYENRGHKRGAEFYIREGRTKRVVVVNENLVMIQLKKVSVYLNMLVLQAMNIVEQAKRHMYGLWYDGVLKVFHDPPARLLYKDTDSLFFSVENANAYAEIAKFVNKKYNIFDCSNYSDEQSRVFGIDNTLNGGVIGLLKDEAAGKIIKSLVAIRAKTYRYELFEGGSVNKAKGVVRRVAAELKKK